MPLHCPTTPSYPQPKEDNPTDILSTAVENLVGYSSTQPSIFKTDQLRPIRDLKLLVRDYPVSSHGISLLSFASTSLS
jgi:hypothetical protein